VGILSRLVDWGTRISRPMAPAFPGTHLVCFLRAGHTVACRSARRLQFTLRPPIHVLYRGANLERKEPALGFSSAQPAWHHEIKLFDRVGVPPARQRDGEAVENSENLFRN